MDGYAIIELRKGVQFRLHIVSNPSRDNTDRSWGWRTCVRSSEAFKHKMEDYLVSFLDRNAIEKQVAFPVRHFTVKLLSDYNAECAIERRANILCRFPNATVRHANIFDFYDYVGYDRKRNRFKRLGKENGTKTAKA